ncbi:MAG: AAA family ATPase [Polyangiaceae bacterium]
MTDSTRFASASTRFRSFFGQLQGAFAERDDVLEQIALALLSKEHVLLAGPPGTAKSQIASAVFGRIVCEETGAPSLYARQITESTVQTDLIGPIDFKNLTETGRTSHFTDEGMLGSVHAFLDEVFDGRDMLLRSALNVLQERELKQGGTITRGRIECALMTSNRYVAEVIEQSRETLLAFIDRIAFIGFVPRGFADPACLGAVLKRNIAGTGRPHLDALLTIQDVDALQAAVDDVYIAPELCDAIAELVTTFDGEVASAARADPAFTPTRYLSTRTAVRCGRILRAACVASKIFTEPHRALEATMADLERLRLHLLLSGPRPSEVEALLAREVDPLEKRQLNILRTEREIFDACIRKLAPRSLTPRARARAAEQSTDKRQPSAKPAVAEQGPLDQLGKQLEEAIASDDARAILRVTAGIAPHARQGLAESSRATALLTHAHASLRARALRSTLEAGTDKEGEESVVDAAVALALALEDGTASMHATARWMQDRALELVDEAAALVAGADASILEESSPSMLLPKTMARLGALEELAKQRRQLLDASATPRRDAGAWEHALDALEELLAAWWSTAFAASISGAIALSKGASLAPVLQALAPLLTDLEQVDRKLADIAKAARADAPKHPRQGVKRRVVGPRLGELVRGVLIANTAADSSALAREARPLVALLAKHDLAGAVPLDDWLRWAAQALTSPAANAQPAIADGPPSHDGYRELREAEHRSSIAFTLADVALIVDSGLLGDAADPAWLLAQRFAALDSELAEACATLDLARVERAVEYLEQWMTAVEAMALADVVRSRIYKILWDESALTRFAAETRLIETLWPHAKDRASRERARIDALGARAIAHAVRVLKASGDQAWTAAAS